MIEQGTINNPVQDPLKLKAIQEIKKLFTKIDFNAEVVPMDNSIKLKQLLISIILFKRHSYSKLVKVLILANKGVRKHSEFGHTLGVIILVIDIMTFYFF